MTKPLRTIWLHRIPVPGTSGSAFLAGHYLLVEGMTLEPVDTTGTTAIYELRCQSRVVSLQEGK